MAIRYAECMVCGKDIGTACNDCSTRKPSSQYTEVQMTWSNGAKMQVAVCLDCAKDHKWTTQEAKEKITRAHQDHWTELGGKFDKDVTLV